MKVRVEYTITGSERHGQTYRNVTEELWQDIVAGLKQQKVDGLIEDYEISAYAESEEEAARMFRHNETEELPATCAEREGR